MKFSDKLANEGLGTLTCKGIGTMQINLGKKCNLNCLHCHVSASADSTEVMSHEVVEACLNALQDPHFAVLDITGGAPELHPDLEYIITKAKEFGRSVIVRTNLVALTLPESEHLFQVFKDNKVILVASLPCYGEENVDFQRGQGTYQKAIFALKKLNNIGYGIDEDLQLDLVYNPNGAFLPGDQAGLEAAYKEELYKTWHIKFNHLLTITNVPIGRYVENYLKEEGALEEYQKLLEDAFNPDTVRYLMCLNQISVAWDGRIYDCDFNQAIDLPTFTADIKYIDQFKYDSLAARPIAVANHCYACTAGSGSGCGGALV